MTPIELKALNHVAYVAAVEIAKEVYRLDEWRKEMIREFLHGWDPIFDEHCVLEE
jgi:hypothetical protein